MPRRVASTFGSPARIAPVAFVHGPKGKSGFTIIELLVVMGVVMILMSLWAPQVSKARAAAKLTRLSVTIQQDATLVLAYMMDHRVFPVGSPTMWGAANQHWDTALVNGGYLPNALAADPEAARAGAPSWIVLSACLVGDPGLFLPGFTVQDPPSMGISESMVTYPSLKGMMLRVFEDPTVINPIAFCCSKPWRVPVAMVDGSVLLGSYLDFGAGALPGVSNIGDYGVPVVSTWRGCRGRDR